MKQRTKIWILAVLLAVLLSVALLGYTRMGNKMAQDNINSNDLQIDMQSEADAEIKAYIDEAFELLKKNGKASEEIWQGYDLSQNSIIVCQRDDITNKVIHAWKLTTAEKSNLTNEQLFGVEIPAAGSYNGLKFEGKKSIIIAVNKAVTPSLKKVAIVNFIYEIGVHEMVHLHYEYPFKLIKLANEQKKHGGRGTAFPKAAEPRVYRKMLYDNLVAAFENPNEEDIYLGKAKYWNEKWKNEYPDEYYQIKVTDVLEGKARYIQYMLCMPKGLSERERAEWISGCFDKNPEPAVSMDSESYKLGFAAGVLLDRRETGWKKQVSKKTEPLTEYLLTNVEIVEDNPENYKEKLEISKTQMAEVNKELDGKLLNIREAEKDIKIPFLQMREKDMAGSYETSAFLNYMDKKLTVDFAGTFENKNGKILINHVSVYEDEKTVILPLTMEYKLSDGRLIIESDEAVGNLKVKQTRDEDGRIIYIMK